MFRTSLRRATLARPAAAVPRAPVRNFHTTPRARISVGDEIPSSANLMEQSAGNKVDLAEELASSKGIILGVPGAFSGTCSSKHIPSYMNHPALKSAGKVFVVAVNDPFVVKAWSEQLDPTGETGIRFLADPSLEFTKAAEMDWDGGAALFGGARSRRYALKVDNGKVSEIFLEPDFTGANESMAEKVLG